MRDYGRIVTKLASTPWLITEEGLDVLLSIVEARVNGTAITDEQLAQVEAARDDRQFYTWGAGVTNGVGVLPLEGPIFGKANLMTQMSGATSLDTFRRDFRAMLADDSIHSIVLEMDTPGGSSDFVQETADEIFASRDVKSTYAIANNMCGSAGLFLASQATKMYSTQSGEVGSLGVFRVHVDQSAKDAKEGYKFSYINAGKYKTEGNPHEPLDKEARAYHQDSVDQLYDVFVDTVARGRGVDSEHVLNSYGQGRMLTAKNALEVGMIDGIMEMDTLVRDLTPGPQQVLVTFPTTSTNSASINLWGFLNGNRVEVADVEHSEPGSGTPPIPREEESDRSGDRNGSGSRRETPPIENPNSGTVQNNATASSMHGEEGNMLSDAALAALGLSHDVVTDEAVSAAIVNMYDRLSANEAAEIKAKTFAELYPEEAAELAASRAGRIDVNAKQFVESHKFVTKGTGDDTVPTTTGLSAIAMERLSIAYKLIASGDDDALEAFGELIDTMMGSGGLVEYGEVGSSRPITKGETPDGDDDDDGDDGDETTDASAAAKMLNRRALKLQREAGAGKLSYGDALAMAASQLPNAAKVYDKSLRSNRG